MPCNKPSEATGPTASTAPVGGGGAVAAAGRVVVAFFFGEKAMMMRNSTQQDRQQCPDLPTAAGPQRSTGSSTISSCSMQHESCNKSAAGTRRKIPSSSSVGVVTWEKPSSSDVIHSRPVSASERGSHNPAARSGGDHSHGTTKTFAQQKKKARRMKTNRHWKQCPLLEVRQPASFHPTDSPLIACAVLQSQQKSLLVVPSEIESVYTDSEKKMVKFLFFRLFGPAPRPAPHVHGMARANWRMRWGAVVCVWPAAKTPGRT